MPTFEGESWEQEAEGAIRAADGVSDFSLDHAITKAAEGKYRLTLLVTRIEVVTENPHVKEYKVWVNQTPGGG